MTDQERIASLGELAKGLYSALKAIMVGRPNAIGDSAATDYEEWARAMGEMTRIREEMDMQKHTYSALLMGTCRRCGLPQDHHIHADGA